ncbi:MAG: hypothetical protein NT069_09285, partial [Planctomycetota bacterium]|nr:hypothetical protein [Planctomycetota bacterium]
AADDDDDESLIERPKAETPPAKRPAKTPATPADDETDDDPLSIRGPAKRTKMTDAEDREAVPSRLPAGSGGAASTDDGGEPPAPRKARPKLTIEKKAPDTAVIGRPMVYEIVVRNTGLAAARGVTVEDVVPAGVRIDGSKPQGQLDGRRLSWRLGTMEPGATQTIAVRVTPQSEGTVGGVATVHFDSEKEGTSKNGPRLQVSVDAPKRATVGQSVNVTFKIRNVGPTDAQRVLIHDVLPAALRHPQGDDLEYEIGDIPAGGMREVQLQLTAAQAGSATNRAVITADGAVSEETVVQLDVIGPALSITRTGPKKLNPNKKGRFTNTVSNPTATALTNVTVVETIPAGMEFLDATDNGQFDPTRRTVTWFVGSLEPKESRSVSISLNTTGRGSQVSVVRASDPSGASGEAVGTASVVGTPALSVEVPDLPGSLDAGQEAPVSVRIYNRGTDAASNTRITLSVPSTMELASIDGPAKYQRSNTGGARGRTEIRFDPIRSIDVKKFAEIKLVLKGRVAGAGRLRVQAACDQIPEPIQREDDVAVVAE